MPLDSLLTFGNGALFAGNSARDDTYEYFGGGAIWACGDLLLSGNTLFTGNLANQKGGAIAAFGEDSLHGSRATLDTTAGSIAFSGNRSGVTFTETSPGVCSRP